MQGSIPKQQKVIKTKFYTSQINLSSKKKVMDQLPFFKEDRDEFKHTAINQAGGNCPISIKKMTPENTVVTDCGHAFEARSIQTWLNDYKQEKCPMCKQHLKTITLPAEHKTEPENEEPVTPYFNGDFAIPEINLFNPDQIPEIHLFNRNNEI